MKFTSNFLEFSSTTPKDDFWDINQLQFPVFLIQDKDEESKQFFYSSMYDSQNCKLLFSNYGNPLEVFHLLLFQKEIAVVLQKNKMQQL